MVLPTKQEVEQIKNLRIKEDTKNTIQNIHRHFDEIPDHIDPSILSYILHILHKNGCLYAFQNEIYTDTKIQEDLTILDISTISTVLRNISTISRDRRLSHQKRKDENSWQKDLYILSEFSKI
jgi:hypothetical protein